MPIDPKLLEILVCPVTKQSVRLLGAARLSYLNARIEEGEVVNHVGGEIDKPFREALVTVNGETIYPVDSGIPVMLEDESIPTVQFSEWPA